MWDDHGVAMFTAAVSHPPSVGLSECYVQMTMGRIRLNCIAAGSSSNWRLLLKDALIDINTRCVRVNGYTPAEILLGYNPSSSRKPIVGREVREPRVAYSASSEDAPVADQDTLTPFTNNREEQGRTAIQQLAHSRDQISGKPSKGYKRPQARDLVLVRDIQLAKEKGKKLEPRWSTPRVLERISKSGVSGHVRQLHDPPGKTKRFHIDDLVPYISQKNESFPASTVLSAIKYSRDAMGDVQGNWIKGQRAFDLSDLKESAGRGRSTLGQTSL